MKKKQGGKRNGSGRKPVTDKKIQLTVYVPQSWTETVGWNESKTVCINALDKEQKKLSKV